MKGSVGNAAGIACAVGCLATIGCGGGASTPPASSGSPVGIVTRYERSGAYDTFLTRLDPATLRPVGSRAEVPELHATWSFSPGGDRIAVGTGGQGLGVHVYDVEQMRLVRTIRTGIAAEGLAWAEPRRLVAALQSGELAVADPASGRVLSRRRRRAGEATCFAEARASAAVPDGLLVLLASRAGQARLLLVTPGGDVRALELPDATWGCDHAGLAVEPGGERAYVLSRDGTVAAVDVTTLRATFHGVSGDPLRRATLRRLRWLGDGQLVTWGLAAGGRPAGVGLLDSRDWTNQMLDAGAREATTARGRVLTFDGVEVDLRGRGRGLSAFDGAGRRLFRALAGEQVEFVHVTGDRAFAQSAGSLRPVDLRSGEVGRARKVPRTEILVLTRPVA